MADIDSIQIGNTTYNIKDASAAHGGPFLSVTGGSFNSGAVVDWQDSYIDSNISDTVVSETVITGGVICLAGSTKEDSYDPATVNHLIDFNLEEDGFVYGISTVNIVGITLSHPALWRDALGLGTMATANASNYLPLTGGTLTGNLIISNNGALQIGTLKTNTTLGTYAFAQGLNIQASGLYSHAEGNNTTASGPYSHAQGQYTTAQRKSQTALGEYNILDTTGTTTTRGQYAIILGNGTASNALSNAMTVDWDGNVWLAGGAELESSIDVVFSNITRTSPPDTNNIYDRVIKIWDSDGSGNTDTTLGYIQAQQETNGKYGVGFGTDNEDGTNQNQVQLLWNINTGAAGIYISHPFEWQRALNLEPKYCSCTTAAATAAKTAYPEQTMWAPGYDYLYQGLSIYVCFTNVNTASNVTFSYHGGAVKPIKYAGTQVSASNYTLGGADKLYHLVYFNNAWNIMGCSHPDVYVDITSE